MYSNSLDNIVMGLFDEKRLHERVGNAWRLFLYLCLNLDLEKECTTTYLKISKDLGVSQSTLKSWRKELVDNSVVRSFSGGTTVHFKLLEPYRNMLEGNSREKMVTTLVPEIVQIIEERLKKTSYKNANRGQEFV